MKRIVVEFLVLLMVCGCAVSEPTSVPQSEPAAISRSPSSIEAEPQPLSEPEKESPKVELQFEKPLQEYKIIAETPIDDGFAIVYEAMMDDEFNRRFSNDKTFWGLYAQLFNTDGQLINTVDFGRHNLYSIPTPVSRLDHENGIIYFESRHTLDNLEYPYEMDYCFYLAVNEAARERIKPSNKDDWYRMKSYYVIEDKDGVSFQIGSEYDEKEGIDRTVFRLAGEDYGESRIVMDYIDPSLVSGLYKIVYNGWEEQLYDTAEIGYKPEESIYDVMLDIDTAASQVTAKNAKATFRMDFAKGVTDTSYRYTEDMLDELIAKSPDGKSEVWAADIRDYFESASGCDYVVKNQSGIFRLCPGNDIYNVIFIGNEKVLVNGFGSLEMYNAADGSLCDTQPQFDYGDIPNPFSDDATHGKERVTVGVAFDTDNKVILVAHRQNTFGSNGWIDKNGKEHYELPVMLTVLDSRGKWFCDIETELLMPPFGKFVAYSVDIECADGIATLTVENREELSAQADYLKLLPPDLALSGTPLK